MSALEIAEPMFLVFKREELPDADAETVAVDLSAATIDGGYLWVANDERASVERLTRLDDQRWGAHEPFDIGALVKLPDEGEMDIEGLDIDGGYLWVVGSHSAKRQRPKPEEHDAATIRERLETLKWDPNRWFLGRLAIREAGSNSRPELVRSTVRDDRKLHSACLPIKKKKGTALVRALHEDEQLGRFMALPAKENGFDVEGLAVRGQHVFLGLRGPVLRGWALILQLRLIEGESADELELASLAGAPNDVYIKHVLDLRGLGIRELCWQGDDLLILAGPTMDIDGPVRLYRWRRPLEATGPLALPNDQLELVGDVPFGDGVDHPEGLAILREPGGVQRLLVINDSPAERRLDRHARTIAIDTFRLPPASLPPEPGTATRTARRPARTAGTAP